MEKLIVARITNESEGTHTHTSPKEGNFQTKVPLLTIFTDIIIFTCMSYLVAVNGIIHATSSCICA